jgi:hypothetical protein
MVVQRVTPLLLHLLATDGYITRTEQQHGAMTWHLLDPGRHAASESQRLLGRGEHGNHDLVDSRRQLRGHTRVLPRVYE